MSRLLIIPARGGSKRIPGKNMYQFGGRPALHLTIELALSSELFDLIVVSSDDDEILASVSDYPVMSDSKRPGKFSNDHATVTEVLKYEVRKLAKRNLYFNEVWQMSSFAFLLSCSDLEKFALQARDIPKDGLLIGLLPFPAPIDWALQKTVNGEVKPTNEAALTSPSQNFGKYFYDSGAIAVFKGSVFNDNEFKLSSLKLFGQEIAPFKAVDVDDLQDILMLELLFFGHQKARELGLNI